MKHFFLRDHFINSHATGCKENHSFTTCHLGKLKLAFTSPDVISTSLKGFLRCRIDFTVLLLFEFIKKHHLRTEFSSPKTKSTSPGLSDTTFFAHCAILIFYQGLKKKKKSLNSSLSFGQAALTFHLPLLDHLS